MKSILNFDKIQNNLTLLFKILPTNSRTKTVFLILLNLLITIFEIIGLFLIIPITAIIIGADNEVSVFFENILNKLYFFEDENSLLILSLLFISIFIFKFIFSIGCQWYQYSILKNIKTYYASKIIKISYEKNWEDWVSESKSKLIQNVITSTDMFCFHFFLQFIILISEVLYLFIILIFFITKFTYVTLLILSAVIILVLIYHKFIIQNFIYTQGKIKWLNEQKRIQTLNEIVLSMKDIILFQKQNLFFDRFSSYETKLNNSLKNLGIFSQVPRVFLELFFVLLFVFILLLLSIFFQNKIIEFFPYIASFSLLLLRSLPSINKIISSFQQIKFSEKSAIELSKALKWKFVNKTKNVAKSFTFKNKITVKNIYFKYKNTKDYLFSNLKFEIKKDKVIGIFGDNGSGKSTLADIICGLLKPEKGAVLCDGKNIEKINWKTKVAVISQRPLLINDTILNNIILGSKVNSKKLNQVIKLADLKKLIKNSNSGINSIIGNAGNLISSGQMQRIGIARALYADKEIIIFDEATNALDENSEKKIISSIVNYRKNKSIIIISHNKKNFFACNEVYNITNKTIERSK